MKQFALVAHGTRGDVEPFLALGRALRGRDQAVTILTHAPYREAVQAAGCEFVAVDDAAGYRLHLLRAQDLVAPRTADDMGDYYANQGLFFDRVSVAGGIEQVRREVLALLALGDDLVVVGRHTSSLSGLLAGELTGAPICLVALSPTQLITAQVAGLHAARAAGGELNALRAKFGLPPVTRWGRWLCTADLVAGLWPQWFDEAGTRSPQPVELLDFPLADRIVPADGPDRLAAMEELVEGAVLITGGSGRMLSPDFYPVAVAGVAASGRRGAVVTPHADLLPQPLPDGIVHAPGLPFAALMPRAAAVVHHGGIGTLARALSAGVPQFLLAHGGDRPDNGSRLESLGLARSWTADDWSPEALTQALSGLDGAADRPAVAPIAFTDGTQRLAALLEDRFAEADGADDVVRAGARNQADSSTRQVA